MKTLKYVTVMKALQEEFINNPSASGVIPTENELAARFGISRFPVNQAVEKLVEEGLLVRVDGIGTFIKGREPEAMKSRVPKSAVNIALVAESFAPESSLVDAVGRTLERAGALLTNIIFKREDENPAELAKRLRSTGTEGVILVPSIYFGKDEHPSLHTVAALESKKMRVVVVDRPLPGYSGNQVVIDNAGGMTLALREIASRGHKKIAYIGKDDYIVGRERLLGFQMGMEYCGLKREPSLEFLIGCGGNFLSSLDELVRKAAKIWLTRHADCTACLAFNSSFAWQLFQALRQEGLNTEDLLLAGFDSPVQHSIDFLRQLLIVIRPYREIGEQAVGVLLESMDKRKKRGEIIKVSPHIRLPFGEEKVWNDHDLSAALA